MNHKTIIYAILSCAMLSPAFARADIPDSVNCPAYRATNTEYTFAGINPSARQIDGVAFPGQNHTIFRGAYTSNPQFDLYIALRGMFNENHWYVSSPMFWGITTILTGERTLDHNFLPTGGLPLTMREYLSGRDILGDVQSLLDCRNGGHYTTVEANELGADLMNKVFAKMTTDRIEKLYFNIADANYYDRQENDLGFGNNAVDLIIGSTYDQISALYGIKTLLIKDVRNRGLDLSFWNISHNNRYFDGWVDNGEINLPGYIRADEVIGYQQRTVDRTRGNLENNFMQNPIDLGFYKKTVGDQTVVLVVDGGRKLCLIQGNDGAPYTCDQNSFDDMRSRPIAYPVPLSETDSDKAALIGVISNCATDACPAAAQAIQAYGKLSDRTLDNDTIGKIAALNINGSNLRWHPVGKKAVVVPVARNDQANNQVNNQPAAPVVKKPVVNQPAAPATIKTVAATYLKTRDLDAGNAGNVTELAAKFLDGKTKATYKVNARFLGIKLAAGEQRAFRLQWTCSSEPNRVLEKTIPAPAERKSFEISCEGNQ